MFIKNKKTIRMLGYIMIFIMCLNFSIPSPILNYSLYFESTKNGPAGSDISRGM